MQSTGNPDQKVVSNYLPYVNSLVQRSTHIQHDFSYGASTEKPQQKLKKLVEEIDEHVEMQKITVLSYAPPSADDDDG